MTTPSQILDEAGDETEACPECKGVGRIDSTQAGRASGAQGYSACKRCGGTGRVPKPKAEQPSAEGVERAGRCGKAPPGWLCSRARDHSGPCAAWPDEGPSDSLLAAVYQRGADPRTRRRALYDYGFAAGVRAADARAALSAIPQPAEVVGPAWRDKPDAEGWSFFAVTEVKTRDGVRHGEGLRARLGLWLAAVQCRTHRQFPPEGRHSTWLVRLVEEAGEEDESEVGEGEGPTLEAALVAALTKVGA